VHWAESGAAEIAVHAPHQDGRLQAAGAREWIARIGEVLDVPGDRQWRGMGYWRIHQRITELSGCESVMIRP